jgi:hypothetical protein
MVRAGVGCGWSRAREGRIRGVREAHAGAAQEPPEYSEKWLCQKITDDPPILGLGEVDVKETERRQRHAGRLDMLLYDPETTTRYEVEVQLGATDESHIIRTIEYWDNERTRWPQYEHVAVIVAEQITARFFNVISLFNKAIPLIAIQLNAIEVNDTITLVFTTVLDRTTLGVEEDDEPDEPRDRNYWETTASKATLQLTDDLLTLVREVEPNIALKYNKNYIGLTQGGTVTNFVSFRPKRQHVIAEFKIPRSEELTQQLTDDGMDLLAYNAKWGLYRFRIEREDLTERADVLRDLIKQAHAAYGLA